MIEEITVKTKERVEFVDVTEEIKNLVRKSGIKNGLVSVYIPHTTAGITINENADPDVVRDIIDVLEKMAPRGGRYGHTEGNADSHVKASLTGSSVTIPVKEGKLLLGTWQGIFLCEFDGPRTRRLILSLIEER